MAVVLLTLACLAIPAPPAAVAQPALNTIFVRANQVGYQPQDTKIGIAFSEAALPDSFAVVRAGSGIAAFQGKTKPVTGVRWGRFENDAELDFSALRAPGRYFLRVGDSKSLPFAISAGAYRELPDQLLEFMREQRCGYNPWLDAVCHPFDGRTAYGPLGERNPYRIGVPFIWCSDNLAVALATQCLLYERMTGDDSYRDFAARQRDWLLGRNPWGYTMFTGIGSVYPKDPHLMTMQLTKRPVRGGLVDGPVYERIFKSLKGVAITEPDPLAAFQGQAVYHDDVQDYSSNEPTTDGTASAILLWALYGSPR